MTKIVWYEQIFCLKALKFLFGLLFVCPHLFVLNSSYQIFFKSKELFLRTKIIFSFEMHFFFMQGKFLWIENIFDGTYSVLHFFDSSNFFSLCKIYKIQIYFYQEIFSFSIALDFRMIDRNRNPGHITRS